MGNCIRRHEKSSWADDEHWEWPSSKSTRVNGYDGENNVKEKEKLVGGKRDAKTTEVKIIISKKELEQLVQMQGLTLEQVVLARMVNDGGARGIFEFEQPRSWKPVLQSIPEMN